MGVCGGGMRSGRCYFGFPLSIMKYLLGEGFGQDAGLASGVLCSLQGTSTLMTSSTSSPVLSEVEGASPNYGWEN